MISEKSLPVKIFNHHKTTWRNFKFLFVCFEKLHNSLFGFSTDLKFNCILLTWFLEVFPNPYHLAGQYSAGQYSEKLGTRWRKCAKLCGCFFSFYYSRIFHSKNFHGWNWTRLTYIMDFLLENIGTIYLYSWSNFLSCIIGPRA